MFFREIRYFHLGLVVMEMCGPAVDVDNRGTRPQIASYQVELIYASENAFP